jgi:putative RecB family exonuclease
MTAPDLPPMTSASQLQAFAMCPRKYMCRYILHLEPEFRSTALVLGSIVHSALEFFYEERLAGRAPGRSDVLRILASDVIAETTDVKVRWKDETPESLEAEAARLVALYLDKYGEEEIVACEVPFEVALEDPETGELRGRPMKGFFDFATARDSIIELKTSARSWNSDLSRNLQIGAYALAHLVKCGGMSDLEVRVLVKLKREPRIETFHVARGEPGIRWFLMAAWTIEDAIAAGHFPPSPGPLCVECEYSSACAAWTSEPDIAPRSVVLPVIRSNAAVVSSWP